MLRQAGTCWDQVLLVQHVPCKRQEHAATQLAAGTCWNQARSRNTSGPSRNTLGPSSQQERAGTWEEHTGNQAHSRNTLGQKLTAGTRWDKSSQQEHVETKLTTGTRWDQAHGRNTLGPSSRQEHAGSEFTTGTRKQHALLAFLIQRWCMFFHSDVRYSNENSLPVKLQYSRSIVAETKLTAGTSLPLCLPARMPVHRASCPGSSPCLPACLSVYLSAREYAGTELAAGTSRDRAHGRNLLEPSSLQEHAGTELTAGTHRDQAHSRNIPPSLPACLSACAPCTLPPCSPPCLPACLSVYPTAR